MNITQEELNAVIEKHRKWVNNDDGGERAYLRWADLSGADLRWADLRWADLRWADLRWADLSGADLSEATKIEQSALDRFFPICCPSDGAFIGWKTASGMIVKLQITEDAKRSSAFGRKCRCSKALVLAIEEKDGSATTTTKVFSNYDSNFVYEIGKTVEVKNFCEDRKKECTAGIHFFVTRQEAVDYDE